jgi:hypothetical protein
MALLSVIGQESELGRIALNRSLQQLIPNSLGEDRGDNCGRPLCRVKNYSLSSLHHHIVQVKDCYSHQEDRRDGQGDDQGEEVIVIMVGVFSGIEKKGIPAHILIQGQRDGVGLDDKVAALIEFYRHCQVFILRTRQVTLAQDVCMCTSDLIGMYWTGRRGPVVWGLSICFQSSFPNEVLPQ